mgnify:CR=1 FL=1
MKSIKNFKEMSISSSMDTVKAGKATKTGEHCTGYDRRKKNNVFVSNTHDWNPFNNDRH